MRSKRPLEMPEEKESGRGAKEAGDREETDRKEKLSEDPGDACQRRDEAGLEHPQLPSSAQDEQPIAGPNAQDVDYEHALYGFRDDHTCAVCPPADVDMSSDEYLNK
ncbi:hypothetical protein NDU88_008772 [Pleurodeles waltl]|uniref:Uncharacterized protein n=1 Tax=Pleurodeles waltl TaxID=8319 RepID=A0AAV7RWP9_PLEWA|nr:hypothetical protein NDU88_008772 [Pleurodeles waltl]